MIITTSPLDDKNMDKFLIAENPMRPGNSGLWVIHLLNPKAIIQCVNEHVTTDAPFRHFQYRNPDGVIDKWTLSAYHFFTTDFVTEPQEQVAPLLNRAWRWFRSYLEFEDQNIDDEKESNSN